jgi:hypothetical protein
LVRDLDADIPEPVVAYRGRHRWVKRFHPLELKNREPAFAVGEGSYLITGGLGRIGLAIAEFLAGRGPVTLVLTGRGAFPAKEDWRAWLAREGTETATGRKIQRLLAIEETGATVIVARADV